MGHQFRLARQYAERRYASGPLFAPKHSAVPLLICLLLCAAPAASAPVISNVAVSSSEVGRYEILEVTAEIQTQATNLFWPYDATPPASIPPGAGVTVDALVSDDRWQTTTVVPAFYFQDYERRAVSTTGKGYNDETFVPLGRPRWKVRFAPTREGEWLVKLRVTDSSGAATYPDDGIPFRCIASRSRGFVKVSARDFRYFELTDGTPLLGPGVNASFHSTLEAESVLGIFGANGVRIARWWMSHRGWQNPFGGGDAANGGGPQWNFSLKMSAAGGSRPGDRYSALLPPGRDTNQSAYLTAGILYRLSGYVKTDGLVASGLNGVVPYLGSRSGTSFTGTNDWSPFSIDFTPATSGAVKCGVKNSGASGTGYLDGLSLKSSSDGGLTWSEDLLPKGDIDFQNYVDLLEARKVDLIFDAAKRSGVYLKTVIAEKQDTSMGCIGADGTTVARSDNNFYASDAHPSRWLQKAWWRYLTARWGAYTSVHSWELCNEGDPFNANHWNAANAFADYVHSVDPNKALCCTSFWHSLPMEFWKRSSCDYIDLHEYFGPKVKGTESHGPRFYAWNDPTTADSNAASLLPIEEQWQAIDYDIIERHGGARSVRITSKPGTGSVGRTGGYPEYHVGVDPSHTYTLRFWAKASNVGTPGGSLGWVRPGAEIAWSKAYHENDWIGAASIPADLGAYDWRLFEKTGIRPPDTANTANIKMTCTTRLDGEGVFRADDIEFIDESTGQRLYVDGGYEADRIDHDTALAALKYGVYLDSYCRRIGKPGVWAETAVREETVAGIPADAQGIHIKKMIWAHAGPANPNMLYWEIGDISSKNLWYHFGAFQAFMDGIPVSNGSYRDVSATVTGSGVRVFGQKDLVTNRAHLWIDNQRHTWKNVVDGVGIEPAGGQITIDGFRDGDYYVEWWDTTLGRAIRTESVRCSQGRITLAVSGLTTDIACKIGPPPPVISLKVTVIEGEIISGGEVTIAVDYANTGASEARNARVTARIPAEMEYVADSAASGGGTYDPVANALTWVVDTVPAGGGGRRTYRAKVK